MNVDIDFSNVPDKIQKYVYDSFKGMNEDFTSSEYNLGRIRGYLDCALDNDCITSGTYISLTKSISDTLQAEIFKISEKTC